MRQPAAKLGLVAAALLAAACLARAEQPSLEEPAAVDEQPPVGFADVEPIFAAHCLKCHGAERQSGGLRLDTLAGATRGGDSGRPLLGTPLADNELYARVSSDDRSYRMPKNADPLSADEIERVRRWVEAGTPWPRPPEDRPSVEPPFYDRWMLRLDTWFHRYEFEYLYARPYIVAVLLVQLALLGTLLVRTAYRAGRPWATGRLARFGRFCDGIKSREIVLLTLLAAACVTLAVARGHAIKLSQLLAKKDATLPAPPVDEWADSPYGSPPRPIRSPGPKRVARTYYRGNCERDPELFNGGEYLTAVFRVSLCDGEHRPLAAGDEIPSDGIFARIEIERAPGTTDLLYSDDMMASVVLVKNFYENPPRELEEEVTRLETLKPDWRWVAYVPLGTPEGAPLAGVIYVYTGQVRDSMLSGTLHYGVGYELHAADGHLAPESDLWMDSFGNPVFAPRVREGLLPYREWFDEQPMPTIEGQNSTDPKLLGVEEYVEKGLIDPPKPAAGKQPPADKPPPGGAQAPAEPSPAAPPAQASQSPDEE